MKFICIKCGCVAEAGTFDDIVRVKKTCHDCRYSVHVPTKKRVFKTSQKPCKECGHDFEGTTKAMYCSKECRLIGKIKTYEQGGLDEA